MARTRILTSLFLAAGALLLTVAAQAQTTMVSCGTNAAGTRIYMEVYEYDYVTEKPSFPGGQAKLIDFINRTREYPEEAYRRGVQGRVMCSFIVNADGSVSNVRVLRGVEPTLNSEARRVIRSMPDWSPGRINGKAVPVRVIYPITFRR